MDSRAFIGQISEESNIPKTTTTHVSAIEIWKPKPPHVMFAAPPQSDSFGIDEQDPAVDGIDKHLRDARALAERHPDIPSCLTSLAACEAAYGKRVSAIKAVKDAAEHAVFDPSAILIAARWLESLGETPSAERALRRVLASDDIGEGIQDSASALLAKILTSRSAFEEALELLEGRGGASSALVRGMLLVQTDRPQEAIQDLLSVVENIPESLPAHATLGYAYAVLGLRNKAISATKSALDLSPRDVEIGCQLARLQMSAGDAEEAVSALEGAAEANPANTRVALLYAAALHATGDEDRAVNHLRRTAQHVDPDSRSAARQELKFYLKWWQQKEMQYTDVFAAATEALERCLHSSDILAQVQAQMAYSPSDLPALKRTNTSAEHLGRLAQLALEQQIAFLQAAFDRSLEASLEWIAADPFTKAGHATAVYLLSLHEGDYARAARTGELAIQRGIADEVIRNNRGLYTWVDAGIRFCLWFLRQSFAGAFAVVEVTIGCCSRGRPRDGDVF